jgi:hypothetical protein
MINSIYVPVVCNGENELFEIKVAENNIADHKVILEDEYFPRYEKLFLKKIPEINCQFGFNLIGKEGYLKDFSNATYSITLATIIAAKVFTYKPIFKEEYSGIVITGNLAEGNDFLCVVDDIEEKYKAVEKLSLSVEGKILFIYVSDEEISILPPDEIEIKRFTSYNTLDEVFDFLFVLKTIDINYDWINKTYCLADKNIINNIICEQLEDKTIAIDMHSISINIQIDKNSFPKNYCPEISENYHYIASKKRLLTTCIKLLFSKEFKLRYPTIYVDYEIILKRIMDLILIDPGLGLWRNKERYDYMQFDVVQKTSIGELLMLLPIKKDDWEKVFKENCICSFLDREANQKQLKEIIENKKPLFYLIEVQLMIGKKWMSECFVPNLLYNYALWVEREIFKEGDVDINDFFNLDKWEVRGSH